MRKSARHRPAKTTRLTGFFRHFGHRPRSGQTAGLRCSGPGPSPDLPHCQVCASPCSRAASGGPGSCAACKHGGAGRRDHRHRQHRRRHHAVRAAGLPRPRHRHVHPRRRHQRGAGLGPRRTRPSRVKEELAAYGVEPGLVRARRPRLRHPHRPHPDARAGYPLRRVTEALCARWQPGVRLLPMSDDRVETHVVIERRTASSRAVHFQEYWVRLHAAGARARRSSPVGAERRQARARACWRPSPRPTWCSSRRRTRWSASARSWPCPASGRRVARRSTGGGPVRRSSAAPRCAAWPTVLAAIGVETTAAAVAAHYGAGAARRLAGRHQDAAAVDDVGAGRASRCRAVPLLMTDVRRHGGDRRRPPRPGRGAASMSDPPTAPSTVTPVTGLPEIAAGDDLARAASPRPRRRPARRRRPGRHLQDRQQGRGPGRAATDREAGHRRRDGPGGRPARAHHASRRPGTAW